MRTCPTGRRREQDSRVCSHWLRGTLGPLCLSTPARYVGGRPPAREPRQSVPTRLAVRIARGSHNWCSKCDGVGNRAPASAMVTRRASGVRMSETEARRRSRIRPRPERPAPELALMQCSGHGTTY
jgi:hypothetical protein